MINFENIKRPSKEEQKAALKSYDSLEAALENIHSAYPEIEIEETQEKIKIPIQALKMLARILKETSNGRPVSIVPLASEITTQAAAEILGCSRPYLIKLLENGKINFSKVGRHRRIKYQDILDYKNKIKAEQRKLLVEIIKADETSGLYDL